MLQTKDLGVHVDLFYDGKTAGSQCAMVKHDQRHIVAGFGFATIALDLSQQTGAKLPGLLTFASSRLAASSKPCSPSNFPDSSAASMRASV